MTNDRYDAAVLKKKQLEREIHEFVPDQSARASMVHTLEKLWSFMQDATAAEVARLRGLLRQHGIDPDESDDE